MGKSPPYEVVFSSPPKYKTRKRKEMLQKGMASCHVDVGLLILYMYFCLFSLAEERGHEAMVAREIGTF